MCWKFRVLLNGNIYNLYTYTLYYIVTYIYICCLQHAVCESIISNSSPRQDTSTSRVNVAGGTSSSMWRQLSCPCVPSCFVLEAAICMRVCVCVFVCVSCHCIIWPAFISFSVIFLCLHPKTNSANPNSIRVALC